MKNISLFENNPIYLFKKLGDLHDCQVEEMNLKKNKMTFSILLDDIFSNFVDLDSNIQSCSAWLNFYEVKFQSFFEFSLINEEIIKIYDANVSKEKERFLITLNCSVGKILLTASRVTLTKKEATSN